MNDENTKATETPDSAASALSAGLGAWVPMSERAPEPDTVCVVWCRYSQDTKGYATVDTWSLQREDPLGMGGPTIPTGYGWDDNYVEDVLYWVALPPQPDESIDQRWEATPNEATPNGLK
jgi:hypothetical protein